MKIVRVRLYFFYPGLTLWTKDLGYNQPSRWKPHGKTMVSKHGKHIKRPWSYHGEILVNVDRLPYFPANIKLDDVISMISQASKVFVVIFFFGCYIYIYTHIYIYIYVYTHSIWLVVSTPLKNISQLGLLFPIYGKIKMFQTTSQYAII